MTADIRPGEFIRLDDVAAELGVSVTPVREALLTPVSYTHLTLPTNREV